MKTVSAFLLTAFFLSSFLCSPLRAEEDLYVEGIVYESHVPEESVAVVNGALLTVGDKIRDYTVKEIQKTSVVFTDARGLEKTVSLLADKLKKPVPVRPSASPLPKNETVRDTPQGPAVETPAEVTNILSKIGSMTILIDLKNIQMKAMFYMSDRNDIPTIASLVKAGMLNPVFASGTKGNYQFSIGSGGNDGIVVYADPVKGQEQLPHYMLDEWANLHVAHGERATAKSEIREIGPS